MGGYGSTRWNRHNTRLTVEDSHKLSIKSIKPYLQPGCYGYSTWSRNGHKLGAISWLTSPGKLESIRLIYTITDRAGVKTDFDYPVGLTWTPTPWGARRWWFSCPECERRAGCLYLPPGGRVFRCRLCCNLTYTSCQESHQFDGLYKRLAASMQGMYPGMTPGDIERALDDMLNQNRLSLEELSILYQFESKLARRAALYASYLTRGELCEQSGLTPDNLAALESARLLLPDHAGKYRPKLVGWGKKLAYLLGEGWTPEELQAWARGRWSTPNPRQFPPERAAWIAESA